MLWRHNFGDGSIEPSALQGACSSQDCPYLHVNLDKNALVCPDFLEGYCARGKSCPNKHLTRRMLQDLQASKRKHKNTNKVPTHTQTHTAPHVLCIVEEPKHILFISGRRCRDHPV